MDGGEALSRRGIAMQKRSGPFVHLVRQTGPEYLVPGAGCLDASGILSGFAQAWHDRWVSLLRWEFGRCYGPPALSICSQGRIGVCPLRCLLHGFIHCSATPVFTTTFCTTSHNLSSCASCSSSHCMGSRSLCCVGSCLSPTVAHD